VGHPRLQPVTLREGFLDAYGPVPVSYCSSAALQIMPIRDLSDIFDMLRNCIISAPSYTASLQSAPGNSGSPVVNASGKVIGVLYAGNGAEVSEIVPLHAVRKFLNSF